MFVILINKTINIISFINFWNAYVVQYTTLFLQNPFRPLFNSMCFTLISADLSLECWVYLYNYLYIYLCPVHLHGNSLVEWLVCWLFSGLYWSLLIPALIFSLFISSLLFSYAKDASKRWRFLWFHYTERWLERHCKYVNSLSF